MLSPQRPTHALGTVQVSETATEAYVLHSSNDDERLKVNGNDEPMELMVPTNVRVLRFMGSTKAPRCRSAPRSSIRRPIILRVARTLRLPDRPGRVPASDVVVMMVYKQETAAVDERQRQSTSIKRHDTNLVGHLQLQALHVRR